MEQSDSQNPEASEGGSWNEHRHEVLIAPDTATVDPPDEAGGRSVRLEEGGEPPCGNLACAYLKIQVAEQLAELQAINAELRQNTDRLELTLDAAKGGVSLWEIGSETLVWDHRMRTLYGIEGDAPVRIEELKALMHPDDCRILFDDVAAVNGPGASDTWNHEFRIKHRLLGERWIRRLGKVERDEDGRALRVTGISFDVTESKRAERAILEAGELLAGFMRNSPIYSYIKEVTPSENRVLFASENFREMVGIPGSEMVGMTMEQLFPPELAASITADDRKVVDGGGMMKVDEELEGRSYVSIKFPIVQGERTLLAGYTMDVTESKAAEQAMRVWNQELEAKVAERTAELHYSEARFRQLAEATFEGIAVTEGGRVMDGNPQLAAIHGYELAEMIGRLITDFIAPDSHALVSKHNSEGYEGIYECSGLRKDGTVFPAEVHGCMKTWQGREIRVTAVRDLTDSKKVEANLRAKQAELAQAQRFALISEVSAGIVHQLGQPLGAMGANIAAAIAGKRKSNVPDGVPLDLLEDLASDVARMRESVVHLRALSNPETPSREAIDFNELIVSVLRPLRHEAQELGIVLETGLGRNLPSVLMDAVQFSQVILNLVHNAFDATRDRPPGHRRVHVTSSGIDGRRIELGVTDTGTGIPEKILDRMFDPFLTTKPDGIGIGLRLARTIVQAHDGEITGSNNQSGPGATFRVRIPVGSKQDSNQ